MANNKSRYQGSEPDRGKDHTAKPTPGKAEGERRSKYKPSDRGTGPAKKGGNVTVGRTPGKAEGSRKAADEALKNQDED